MLKAKKIPKTLAALIGAVFIAASLSSCAAGRVEELLSPPRLDGEQSEIYDALKSFTSGDITLKYPKSGSYRSAFVVKNLDSEPTDEAMVFYELPNVSDGSSLRICFLDKRDGKWVSVYDLAAGGSEIESVVFSDLGDGNESVLVTYLVQNSSDKATSVLQYRSGTPAEIFKGRHSFMDVIDYNESGHDVLFMILADRNTGTAAADIFGFKNGTFTLLSASPLSGGFAEYRRLTSGKLGVPETPAVFLDYTLSDGSSGTEVLTLSGGRLMSAPAVNASSVYRYSNSYTPDLYCTDIDMDGITEIPSCVPFPGYEDIAANERMNMTVWYKLSADGRKLSECMYSFAGTRGDYIFVLPPRWYGVVTASYSITEGSVTFGRYSSNSVTFANPLLKIYSAAEGNTKKYDSGDYICLGKSLTTGYSYYAEITGGNSVSLTEEELAELFRLI